MIISLWFLTFQGYVAYQSTKKTNVIDGKSKRRRERGGWYEWYDNKSKGQWPGKAEGAVEE
jgi:hypothetical protein